jgi:hypothetical protein
MYEKQDSNSCLTSVIRVRSLRTKALLPNPRRKEEAEVLQRNSVRRQERIRNEEAVTPRQTYFS